jgi:predicted nucleic acid-binding protein
VKVLVDTSIWSLALRRGTHVNHKVVEELRALVADHRVEMIGPIRQELLSGIRNAAQFEKLQNHLTAFPDIPIGTEDYEMAAKFYNLCRSKSVQGSNTDFLICAIAVRHHLAIFSTDNDFQLYAKHLPIVLLDH